MIASLQNPLVKHLAKLREDQKYRQEEGSVVVSGYKLVEELAQICAPKKILLLEGAEKRFSGPIIEVSLPVLKKITGLPAPEEIAAEFPLPGQDSLMQRKPLLALDAIRDPGNLGTLIRTAIALGWGGVFFLPTCVDPFHEKVVRASRGALFRLPWKNGSWEELAHLCQHQSLTTYIADTEGIPLDQLPASKEIVLLLSNEAQGVQETTKKLGKKITIPMPGDMESLNVATAGAILMYMLRMNV